jgi:hypothetical protein
MIRWPAAEGRVVIDPATGALLAADIRLLDSLAGAVVRGTLQVTFRPDTLASSWVPDVMTEHYDILNDRGDSMGTITGRAAYSNVVKLTFAKGASLKDPTHLFNSSLEGNVRRAIDIREGEDVDAAALKALVRDAVAVNTAGKANAKKTTSRRA